MGAVDGGHITEKYQNKHWMTTRVFCNNSTETALQISILYTDMLLNKARKVQHYIKDELVFSILSRASFR